MAHATFVKKARKNYPEHGIKKGESYYWWSFRSPRGKGGSGRYFSKTPPRRSQLTRSDFYSALFDIQDTAGELSVGSYESVGSMEGDVESIKSDLEQLQSDTQEKLDNMPEGLQQGDTGQLLQERIDGVESLVSDFDGLDFSEPDEDDIKREKGETKEDALARAVEEKCQEIKDEIDGFNWP